MGDLVQLLGPFFRSTFAVLQALATPIIAAAGVYIAYQQKRQGDIRLQIERFDRRYAIYLGAKELLASIFREGTFNADMLFPFLRDTGDAVFLTNAEIVQYLDELRLNAIKLQVLKHQNKWSEEADLLTWFAEQYPILQEKFRPLLSYETSARAGRPFLKSS
jgi:hypothetical protein